MPFKTILLSLLFCLWTNNVLYSQSSEKQTWLWEISGESLEGKSYLLGAMHLNDSRLFNFDDSLFLALQNCEAFGNEVNFDSISSYLLDSFDLAKEIGKGSEGPSDGFEDLDNVFGPSNDVNGMQTILDLYLYSAARNLGKEIIGLERIEEQMDLYFNLENSQDDYPEFGSAIYEDYIEIFVNGDSMALAAYMDDNPSFNESYQMASRNNIQAANFYKIAQEKPFFAVVGAGHLVGENNVIEQLKSKGLKVRRVNRGEENKEIHALFRSSHAYEFEFDSIDSLGLKVGVLENTIKFSKDQLSLFMDLYLEKGLIFYSLAIPIPKNSSHPFSIKDVFKGISKRLGAGEILEVKSGYNSITKTFALGSRNNEGLISITANQQMVFARFCLSASKMGMKDELVGKYMNAFQISDVDLDWKALRNSTSGITFDFPVINSPQTKEEIHPNFPNNGYLRVETYSHVDANTGNEFVLSQTHLPAAAVFEDPVSNLNDMIERLSLAYKGDIDSTYIKDFHGYDKVGASIVDSFGNHFFVEVFIDGNCMVSVVQKSPYGHKEAHFFDKVKIGDKDEPRFEKFSLPEEKFEADLPPIYFKDSSITTYYFSQNDQSASFQLDFEPHDRYVRYLFDKEVIDEEIVTLKETYDSLLYYSPHWEDGRIIGTDYLVFDRKENFIRGLTRMLSKNQAINFYSFYPSYGFDIERHKRMTGSFVTNLSETEYLYLTSPKGKLLLEDLASTDSLIFATAKERIYEFEDFTTDDIETIKEFFYKPSLDDNEENSAKYLLLTDFENLSSGTNMLFLEEFFQDTDNKNVKARILEIWANYSTAQSFDLFFNGLGEIDSSSLLRERAFYTLQDSFELFIDHFESIRNAVDKGFYNKEFLGLSINNIVRRDSSQLFEEHKEWFREHMDKLIDDYRYALKLDTSVSIDPFFMDYLAIDSTINHDKTYEFFMSGNDVYGKYRTVSNLLHNEEEIPQAWIEEACIHDRYFHYYTVGNFSEKNRYEEIPDHLRTKEEIAKSTMSAYFYDNFSVDLQSCDILKEVSIENHDQKQNALLTKCDAPESTYYYLGLVGPFKDDGTFDFNGNLSIYYTSKQEASDPTTLLPKLKDGFINQ